MKSSIGPNSFTYRMISAAGQVFIKMIEVILVFFSTEKEAVIDPIKMPWAKKVEENADKILIELDQLLKDYSAIPALSDLSQEQKSIIHGEQNWKTFVLYMYGAAVAGNIKRCPDTGRVVRDIHGMTTAFFSILEPHTSLIPHRGPYKGVLRYHLGLIIPSPKESCGIRVGGQVYHWEVGKSLIFDDTRIHEAWNNSDAKRVVLFVDFKRDFIFPVNKLNDAMILLISRSPFISNVLKKIEDAH
jgi:beta-hydroxylase